MWPVLQEKHALKTKVNEFLTIFEALEAVTTKTIFLLTIDVTTRQLFGDSRDIIEETLKSLHIQPEVLARSFIAMWDILLAFEEEAKKLAGGEVTTKSV